MSQPGGASLDGEAPASASAAIRPAEPEVGASSAHGSQTPRGPGGASIDCSSAWRLPVAAFSTADRACDIASDVLHDDPRRTWPCDQIPSLRAAGPTSTVAPSKVTISLNQDAFRRRALPPPRAFRFRVPRVGSLGACHRSRCSRARGSRHCDPASGAASPAVPPRGRARGLDPWPRGLDQTPLVDFCNQNNPRARPRDRPIPPRAAGLPWRRAPSHGAASDPIPRACACALRSPRELSLLGSCRGTVATISPSSLARRLTLARSLPCSWAWALRLRLCRER